jgi:glutamyl-tRNA synthetase
LKRGCSVITQGTIRVRFAPSPTGHLHIGGVRSAMFNWLFARHTGGTFLIRVEDTDTQRSSQAYVDSQLRSLEWVGLVPDEPIVFQLQRQTEHLAAAQRLMQQGLAYPCFCQPREADDVINDLELGQGHKYPGTCRSKAYTQDDLLQPHAVRFKLPSDLTAVTFDDIILGSITTPADQLDDFVIIRRDGTPIYNFCVVVDDIHMKITHVIRGQDHVSNTPKQVLYYRALGAQLPQFAHIPLILNPNGGKLSKRDAAVSVEDYRLNGYLPDALINYLVRLGWSHGDQEIFTREELVQFFTLDTVGKKGGVFDTKKLQWLNGIYMRQKSTQELLEALNHIDPGLTAQLSQLWQSDQLTRLVDLYKERAVLLTDLHRDIAACANDPQVIDLALISKWQTAATKPALKTFMTKLEALAELTHETLIAAANESCTEHTIKLVALAQPLRLALVGSITSPGVFDLISVLGKERSVKRINKLVDSLE